jgi:hypothetical protein
MKPMILPAALAAIIFCPLATAKARAMPVASSFQAAVANAAAPRAVVRVHGSKVAGPHCDKAWSTSAGWHLHPRGCDLPQYNPDWRDPRHWHWRLYEEARARRYQRWRRHERPYSHKY